MPFLSGSFRPSTLRENQLLLEDLEKYTRLSAEQIGRLRSEAGFPPGSTMVCDGPGYEGPQLVRVWLRDDVDRWLDAVKAIRDRLR